jgi:TldD protein
MIDQLQRVGGLGKDLCDRARGAGALAIWRAQARSNRHAVVREGRVESTGVSTISGHGLQVLTDDGRMSLASRDDFRPEPARSLLDRSLDAARLGADLGLRTVPLPDLEPTRGRAVPDGLDEFDRIDLSRVAERLHELERRLQAEVPGVGVRLGYRSDLDAWRVLRSDGTDVLFAMPRCGLTILASSDGDGDRHTVRAAIHDPSPRCAWDDAVVERFLTRGVQAARLARELPDAPTHPPGTFALVIDYALAKGLAHEAFGHASEADGFRSSILAREGRFRTGEQVGAPHVSIVDEPVEGDHAWQPFSANGVRRDRAVLVDRGCLRDGLSDPWSSVAGGVRLTGAARAESFRNAPLPRMSNIRIEIEDPLPAPGRFEDHGPETVRDLLGDAGVFRRHSRVAFLSGYSGGQVNSATGDFVFHCKAIYGLSPSRVELFKPAIFSGSMFGALRSVREAFGPLHLDALGFCGKWGQSVPSSGGSHSYLVLEPHPQVKLGGR